MFWSVFLTAVSLAWAGGAGWSTTGDFLPPDQPASCCGVQAAGCECPDCPDCDCGPECKCPGCDCGQADCPCPSGGECTCEGECKCPGCTDCGH